MTIPFWCLFAAAALPYVWFSFAAPLRSAQFGQGLDTHTPRAQDPKLLGRAARLQGVHLNGLEALTYFAPAVIVAHLAHANVTWSARLSVAFIAIRLIHAFMYITDRPALRTASFGVGLLTALGLFVLAACA